jgi:hypothetical protein
MKGLWLREESRKRGQRKIAKAEGLCTEEAAVPWEFPCGGSTSTGGDLTSNTPSLRGSTLECFVLCLIC